MDAVVTPDPQLIARPRSESAAPPSLSASDCAALLSNPWFCDLPAALRTAIVNRVRVVRVPAGTVITRRGQSDGNWTGVIQGAVRLSATVPDGRAFTLAFLSQGHWFGDPPLVEAGASEADFVAHVASTLAVVSHTDMLQLLELSPDLSHALLQLNCQRLRTIYRHYAERFAFNLPQRLARQVRRLALQFGRPTSSGVHIDLAVSQSDLASMVGGSRQRVNRALRQMQQMGILQLATQRLTVLDVAGLSAVATGAKLLPGSTSASDD